ncbi:carbohydrate ABC transporter permease [Paenibacillus sp. YN15]|uniref:carbohydrate ABC transporter permease n=1 Tax=Paenibacillus sp. YN15 TaxID=1742774 RepID=UPI00215C13FC|nr:carbohydrate ABC transporter permease [Paenibacillus sp. YN15]
MAVLKKTVIYAVLIFYALLNIYPLFWMINNSFKSDQEIALHPFALPSSLSFANFSVAWESANLGPYFLNSLSVSIVSLGVTVLLGAMASYFLSRIKFKGSSLLYSFFIVGMLVPVHATLVPVFLVEKNLNILNTWVSLVLPYTAFHLPITIFILTSFMGSFHKDIEESAVMDGCGIFGVFFRIILPMTRPALATVVILNFIYNWNEFSFALVLVNNEALKTLPLAIAGLTGEFSSSLGPQMAALTMAVVPTIIIYLLLEKQLVKGMTAGAVKG